MRAVKSVLLASASLRRLHPELPEAKIVLRAIIDVNLPKFLEQDVGLFVGIYNDLFPGVDVPQVIMLLLQCTWTIFMDNIFVSARSR